MMRAISTLGVFVCLIFVSGLNCGPSKDTYDASEVASETSAPEPTKDTKEAVGEAVSEPTKSTQEPAVQPAKEVMAVEPAREPIQEPFPSELHLGEPPRGEPALRDSVRDPARELILDASGAREPLPDSREPLPDSREPLPELPPEPLPEPTKEAPTSCPSGQLLCRGQCVLEDKNNCGACGNACPTSLSNTAAVPSCTRGRCLCSFLNKGKHVFGIACGGKCIDPLDEPQHCGACQKGCRTDQVCASPKIFDWACACPQGQSECNGVCKDLQTDANHCGGCGTICPSGTTCTGGLCLCPQGKVLCNGQCITPTDASCGTCGNYCPSDATCNTTKGVCECPTGKFLCNGQCITSNDKNCGACGKACGTGQVCETFNNTCTTPCSPSCGSNNYCSKGQCLNKCSGSFVYWCDGKCTYVGNNDQHCGACNRRCKYDQYCTSNGCFDRGCAYLGEKRSEHNICYAPVHASALHSCESKWTHHSCGACRAPSCAPNQVCDGDLSYCVASCPTGRTACSGLCRNLLTDRNHCGSCTNACADDKVCSNGMCVAHTCSSGMTPFKGTCVDLQTDKHHCGSLKNACFIGQSCVKGLCIDPSP